MTTWPQPSWNEPDSVALAIAALARAHDEASAVEAGDRFLWAVGDSQAGTFHPVVLSALPELARLLEEGGAWTQHAVIESLLDLGGPFAPAEGLREHGGVAVQDALRDFIAGLRPRLVAIAEAGHAASSGATELVELIDELED